MVVTVPTIRLSAASDMLDEPIAKSVGARFEAELATLSGFVKATWPTPAPGVAASSSAAALICALKTSVLPKEPFPSSRDETAAILSATAFTAAAVSAFIDVQAFAVRPAGALAPILVSTSAAIKSRSEDFVMSSLSPLTFLSFNTSTTEFIATEKESALEAPAPSRDAL